MVGDIIIKFEHLKRCGAIYGIDDLSWGNKFMAEWQAMVMQLKFCMIDEILETFTKTLLAGC